MQVLLDGCESHQLAASALGGAVSFLRSVMLDKWVVHILTFIICCVSIGSKSIAASAAQATSWTSLYHNISVEAWSKQGLASSVLLAISSQFSTWHFATFFAECKCVKKSAGITCRSIVGLGKISFLATVNQGSATDGDGLNIEEPDFVAMDGSALENLEVGAICRSLLYKSPFLTTNHTVTSFSWVYMNDNHSYAKSARLGQHALSTGYVQFCLLNILHRILVKVWCQIQSCKPNCLSYEAGRLFKLWKNSNCKACLIQIWYG